MAKLFFYDNDAPQQVYHPVPSRRRYGLFRFLVDCTMVMLTGGFWIIWIFVRESRKR